MTSEKPMALPIIPLLFLGGAALALILDNETTKEKNDVEKTGTTGDRCSRVDRDHQQGRPDQHGNGQDLADVFTAPAHDPKPVTEPETDPPPTTESTENERPDSNG